MPGATDAELTGTNGIMTSYMSAAGIPGTYTVLGTDGFGRSDTRKNLRRHFEVNSHYVTVATLKTLADEGAIPATKVNDAIKKYGIDIKKPNPLTA